MGLPFSKGEINRLGDRLRARFDAGSVDPDDLHAFQALRSAHDDALAEVAYIIVDELSTDVTTRLKTINTTVAKLKRESIRLSAMQDIAGCRLTVTGGRLRQDEVVTRLLERFPDSKVKDRRREPSHGYRAVHVIVRHDDCRVEIQVRTELQDKWAQIVERLGDIWGRGIRYGEDPPDPDAPMLDMGALDEAQVEELQAADEFIQRAREWLDLPETIEEHPRGTRAVLWQGVQALGDAIAVTEEREREVATALDGVRAVVEWLQVLVKMVDPQSEPETVE